MFILYATNKPRMFTRYILAFFRLLKENHHLGFVFFNNFLDKTLASG